MVTRVQTTFSLSRVPELQYSTASVPASAGIQDKTWSVPRLLCMLLITWTASLAAQDRQALTLESIFAGSEFDNDLPQNIQWHNNAESITFTKKSPDTGQLDIHEHDIASGATRLIISGDILRYENEPVRISRYQWAANDQYILLAGPVNLTWDGRNEAPYYIYEPDTNKLWPLADNNPGLRDVYLSPDGEHVGYVLENNLYITALEDRTTRVVTSDGDSNIFNGYFDYGSKMFSGGQAWFWSPDGKMIAFWRLDATDVKVFYMVDELGKYNTVRPMKYPNTGERLAVTRIGVFDLEKRPDKLDGYR